MEDPLVRSRLGRMLVDVRVMRATGLRTLWRLENGDRPGQSASRNCSQVKWGNATRSGTRTSSVHSDS
jgi:alkylation response protein AidB-like acyl-CoA dehydrogenase